MDGFLCKNSEEWTNKLQQLVKNENLRKQIAHDAHERVMKEYMTDDMELEVFKTIVG